MCIFADGDGHDGCMVQLVQWNATADHNPLVGNPLLTNLSFYPMMMRLVSALLLLLAIAYPTIASIQSSCQDSDCVGPALSQLLANVSIHIPDQNISSGGLNLSLTDIVCANIQLQDIELASSASALNLTLAKAGLACQAQYHFKNSKFPYIPFGSGSLVVIPDDSSLNIDIQYQFDNQHVPLKLNVDRCQADIKFSKLTFSGGVGAFILDIMTAVFKGLLESLLDKVVCQQVSQLINVNVTQAIGQLNGVFNEYINISEPVLNMPPPVHPGMVNFAEMDSVLTALDKVINSSTSSGKFFVDELIDFITGESGVLELDLGIQINLGDDGLTDTNLTVGTLKIFGLDSFSDLHLIKPVHIDGYPGNYSLELEFTLDKLALYVDGNVSLGPGSLIVHDKGIVVEYTNLTFGLQKIHVKIIVQVEISQTDIMNIKFGQLSNSFVGCLSKFMYGTNATFVDVSIGSFTPPQFGGFGGLSPLLNELVSVLDEMFGVVSLPALHGAMATGLKSLLNDVVNEEIAKSRADVDNLCPSSFPVPSPENDIIDFTAPISMLLGELLQLFSVPSPLNYSANWLVDVLTDYQGSIKTGSPGGVAMSSASEFGLSYLNVSAGNLKLLGLDHFYDVNLLNPQAPREIQTRIGIGGLSAAEPINASIGLHLDLQGSAIENEVNRILDDFQLLLALNNLSLSLDLTASLKISSFLQLDLSSLFDADRDCLFTISEALALENLQIHLNGIALQINCDTCSSPKLNVWSSMLQSPSAINDLHSDVASFLTHLGSKSTLNFINTALDKKISGASRTCHPSIQTGEHASSDSSSSLVKSVLVGSLPTAFVGIGLLWYFCIHKRNGDAAVKPQEGEVEPLAMKKANDSDSAPTDQESIGHHYDQMSLLPLYKNDLVNPIHKWLIPTILVIDIALFIAANTTVGASVNLIAQLAGDTLQLPSLFSFSLGNSIREMWNAKVYPLALLILVFSGMWPYAKALLMLACWLLPPRFLAIRHRKRIMHWLDILGKWSLVDAYVLVLMMVAFRFHIASPDGKSYIPDQLVVADVIVFPGFGIHGFLIAAVLQLIITHWIIHYDRTATLAAQKEEEESYKMISPRESAPDHADLDDNEQIDPEEEKVSLFVWSQQLHDADPVAQVQITGLAKAFMSFVLLLAFVMTAIGVITDSFRFEFKGAAGFALGDAATHSYSLVSVANTLLRPDAGVIFLWFIFLLFAVVVPLFQLFTLFVLWVWPMRRSSQTKALHLVEVLRAMGAIDVFIVSVVAALYELKQFVAFIIGDKCDGINTVLRRYAGGSLSGEDVCFDVIAELDSECWMLLLAAILGVGMTFIMLEICENALDSLPVEEGQDPVSCVKDWPVSLQYNKNMYKFLVTIGLVEAVHSPNQLKRSSKLK